MFHWEREGKNTYLCSYISSNRLVTDKISGYTKNSLCSTFSSLPLLWSKYVKKILTSQRVYCAAFHSVLLNGCETRTAKMEDSKRLAAFFHRCSRSIACAKWYNMESNIEIRCSIRQRKQVNI
uniref:Uncharacterized protein n=1 Tax=Trichobilharzia regenti TaxID=157069 RepID=A0AA85JXI1_TRIRE|nr:unnamed protein product [Trichobilharzia regenti]